MKRLNFIDHLYIAWIGVFFLSACSMPTLVEIARRRQATADDLKSYSNVKDDVRVKYHIADWDILNFTDEVKRKLSNRSSLHIGFGYGTVGTQATLGALAGAARTLGWGVAAASGLGLGATFVFGLGQIFDSKGHAQAYEQSFTAVQAAESAYYFRQLGMSFDKNTGLVDLSHAGERADIPSQTVLTPDGETLYYRVSKILKVLNDVLASKIPDLQDLKDAKGDWSASPHSPASPGTSPTPKNIPNLPPARKSPTPSSTPSSTEIPNLPPARKSPTPSSTPSSTEIPNLPPAHKSPTPSSTPPSTEIPDLPPAHKSPTPSSTSPSTEIPDLPPAHKSPTPSSTSPSTEIPDLPPAHKSPTPSSTSPSTDLPQQ